LCLEELITFTLELSLARAHLILSLFNCLGNLLKGAFGREVFRERRFVVIFLGLCFQVASREEWTI